MKTLVIAIASFAFSFSTYGGEMTANELYQAGLNLKNQPLKITKNGAEGIGGLIQRHPLLNHARTLFKKGSQLPGAVSLEEGRTWTCLQFTGLDFQSEIIDNTTSRSLSFENYGAGIIKEISYGNNQTKLYANDDGELAGVNGSGDLYEAIRITADGDLILESSVQGLSWWQKFFMSLTGGGRPLSKLLGIVQQAMVSSVSNTKNGGLVFDYSVCPQNKIIDGVVQK